jgi:hypothetical protein
MMVHAYVPKSHGDEHPHEQACAEGDHKAGSRDQSPSHCREGHPSQRSHHRAAGGEGGCQSAAQGERDAGAPFS